MKLPIFDILPVGAIFDKRYESLENVFNSPEYNEYRVFDSKSQEKWRMRELPQVPSFQYGKYLLDKQIHHPALIAVQNAFTWQPYGPQPRSYVVVEPGDKPITESNLKPVSEVQMLTWGAQLAGGLAYLHQQNLVHRNIEPKSIFLFGNNVKLGEWSQIKRATPEAQATDVYQLAQTLYWLATPPGQKMPAFSKGTTQVMQRALAPNPAQRYATAREFGSDLQDALEAARRPQHIRLVAGRLTDVGQRRELNEDALAVVELDQQFQTGTRTLGLYVVADGMGGAAAGEVASKIVTEIVARSALKEVFEPRLGQDDESQLDYGAILQAAAQTANRAILDARRELRNDMGSTLVAALMVEGQAYVINIGDSRAYLISRDRIEKVSKDHSLVQTFVDSRTIREEDVYTHPQRNIIMRSMGEKSDLIVDLFVKTIEPGQFVLLGSDGLWEMVRDPEIHRIVTECETPQEACGALIAAANRNGGDDNITGILIKVEAARSTP
ncbi:MAG: protein phosphatase 2C domain-containing protein [Anaerolineae bacterium]